MKQLNTFAFILIILATVTFSSCKDADTSTAQRLPKGNVILGGSLTIAETAAPKLLVPNQIADAISSRIGSQIHCGLLRLNAQSLEIVPAIAQSWSVDEAGTSYVFHLRSGVLFHADACFGNGSREVTANNFEYAFKQLCSNGSLAYATTFKGRVKGADAFFNGETETLSGVQVIDDYTLKIELKKPDPSFLYVLAQPSTAAISKKAMEKYGGNMHVGAGAFVYSAKENGLLFTRNQEWFLSDAFGNQPPYIDTLVVKFVATKEKQLQAFFDGEIDMVTNLYLDPVRQLLEEHVAEFSGKNPTYIMSRETESVGYESYTIMKNGILGFNDNFMGYRDFSQVQISD